MAAMVWLGKFGRKYRDSQVHQQQKKTSGPRALTIAHSSCSISSDATEPASPTSFRFHYILVTKKILRKQAFQRHDDLIGVQPGQSQELFRFHETQSQGDSDMSEIY